MAETLFWNRHDDADRIAFSQFLAPLVTCAYPSKVMRDKHWGKAEATAYLLTLQDVPREILALGISRLITAGVTWMPKPGDVKAACADIVDERRAAMGKRVADMKAKCQLQAEGHCISGLIEVDGKMQRCECHVLGIEMLQQVAAPIARLQLPPAEHEVV